MLVTRSPQISVDICLPRQLFQDGLECTFHRLPGLVLAVGFVGSHWLGKGNDDRDRMRLTQPLDFIEIQLSLLARWPSFRLRYTWEGTRPHKQHVVYRKSRGF